MEIRYEWTPGQEDVDDAVFLFNANRKKARRASIQILIVALGCLAIGLLPKHLHGSVWNLWTTLGCIYLASSINRFYGMYTQRRALVGRMEKFVAKSRASSSTCLNIISDEGILVNEEHCKIEFYWPYFSAYEIHGDRILLVGANTGIYLMQFNKARMSAEYDHVLALITGKLPPKPTEI